MVASSIVAASYASKLAAIHPGDFGKYAKDG
jgi:hypothetical protein